MRTAPCSVPSRWRGSRPGHELKNPSKPEKLHHRPLAACKRACLRREAVGWVYPFKGGGKELRAVAATSPILSTIIGECHAFEGIKCVWSVNRGFHSASSSVGGGMVPKKSANARSARNASSRRRPWS